MAIDLSAFLAGCESVDAKSTEEKPEVKLDAEQLYMDNMELASDLLASEFAVVRSQMTRGDSMAKFTINFGSEEGKAKLAKIKDIASLESLGVTAFPGLEDAKTWIKAKIDKVIELIKKVINWIKTKVTEFLAWVAKQITRAKYILKSVGVRALGVSAKVRDDPEVFIRQMEAIVKATNDSIIVLRECLEQIPDIERSDSTKDKKSEADAKASREMTEKISELANSMQGEDLRVVSVGDVLRMFDRFDKIPSTKATKSALETLTDANKALDALNKKLNDTQNPEDQAKYGELIRDISYHVGYVQNNIANITKISKLIMTFTKSYLDAFKDAVNSADRETKEKSAA